VKSDSGKFITILLVEDDPGHARLIEKNFRRANVHNDIVHLSDGKMAMDYLFSEGEYADHILPDTLLVLLDLNMPVYSGFDVLERMKRESRTRRIPVVILTTTDDNSEIDRCYELGCNVYVTKPVDYDQFTEAMQQLGFLLKIVAVPRNRSIADG